MFAAFSVIAVVVVFGTLLLEDQYRSTATIAIIRPEIPENMVRTTFTYFDTDLRVDQVRDRVLTSPNVEELIKEFDLYQETVLEKGMNFAVSEFRSDVEVITIQAREDIAIKKQGETIAFDVSYYGESPAKSALVATELANRFLEENRASRNESVQNTVDFFQRDVDRLALKIDEAETKLADFKERHAGALPNSAFANTQLIDRYERELGDVEREIRDLREARQILETDLSTESPNAPIFSTTGETILAGQDRLKLLQQQLVELSAKYGPEHPDVIRTRREIDLMSGGDASQDASIVRQELEIARREYAAARQRYTADHPDVVNLQNKVRTLEARLASIDIAPQPVQDTRPDNPVYINILVQIEAADAELYALRIRARELRDRIRQYQEQMLQAPQIEREYLAFQRNYDQAVSDYNEVREKQTEAQQALDLETSEKGERYVLQRSPVEPISAAFPNRLAIIILGAIFAFVCSFGAVLIAEAFDAKVRSVRDLKNLTGMPPIAIIPVIETQATRRKRVYAWSFSIVGVASLLLFMISIQI
jgi:uncharacterized protein involved in exopolysaccharide biosynthesis